MKQFLNFMIGLGSFVSIAIVTEPFNPRYRDAIAHYNTPDLCIHVGLTVAAVLFLQFAIQRYLFPPDLLSKQRRQTLIKSAESMGIFFTGLSGLGYLCLFLYAFRVFDSLLDHPIATEEPSFLGYSLFLLFLALVGRTRGVILQLLDQQKTTTS
jgi:magnesium-transporting ATPase (P-type)